MLERERSRADRAQGIFSLLVIDFKERRASKEATLRTVNRVLRERLRATDLTGYMTDGRIGVLLADTEPSGAQQLADAIAESFEQEGIVIEIDMFTYPSESLPAEVGSDEADSEADSGSIEPLYAKALPLWKRCLDVLGALAGLVLLSPLLLLTALAIKLTSRGPIFFSQLRSGLGGKPFTLHKFRTMCTDAEAQKAALMTMNEQDGPAFKMKNDPRITPLGRFLRKSCIDELPQLVNVLKGDMTLVGPRPLPCDEADRCQAWEKRRLTVTPGLTCSWQAGARRVTFAEWMRMDLRYIRQRTLANDCRLLWKTFLKVIRNRASH
jgi:lipopolysaccharide/colanic/teichoic acid biosynthesis glycosyltransferase